MAETGTADLEEIGTEYFQEEIMEKLTEGEATDKVFTKEDTDNLSKLKNYEITIFLK